MHFQNILLFFIGFVYIGTCFPQKKLAQPSTEYILGDFDINSGAVTRKFEFVCTNTTASPDGFLRGVLAINNQIPGPLIEANEGDHLDITVINNLDSALTIHWHGLYQNGTNSEDGVTGITQCPIPSGGRYTYKFQLNGQFGTFWYHAHHQNLLADGLYGPLIIHSPRDPLKRGIDFDEDVVLMIADWYHNTSSEIVKHMLSEPGYFGTPAAPSPNSVIMNGIGDWDCNRFATIHQRCEKTNSLPVFNVVGGKRIRFRIINAGSHAMIYFSGDEHSLNVTEADSTPVYGPSNVHRIKFHNGQRYSVIINTQEKEVGSSFYLRGTMDTDCFAWVAGDIQKTGLAIVRVIKPDEDMKSLKEFTIPNTKDWSDEKAGSCVDLDPELLNPIIPIDVPETVAGSGTLANAFGFQVISTGVSIPRDQASKLSSEPRSISSSSSSSSSPSSYSSPISRIKQRQLKLDSTRKVLPLGTATSSAPEKNQDGPPPTPAGARGVFFVNDANWKTYPYHPVLHDMLPGGPGSLDNAEIANVVYPNAEWYDLYLVNLDPAISHSYHLHAMDMHLVAFGKGKPTPENLSKLKYRTKNPLRRDTIVIDAASYAVVRVLADIPGVWIMHCHIGWHLAGGFAGVVIVQPNKIKQLKIPNENKSLCKNRKSPLNQYQPGKRR
ncbi:multicopper-oxidase laccase-like protein [Melampsora larici-populina 98AG31]|uniref:Multicopper-oxidase laccase-like protein n=1 Tax=Melampsora larici-populina (strain 98AG31 / pathotype 3-4-7) TaxID=747676 RepID=F4R859_MELLP|nr:multicopper-oxidase laccase-like protein [Melampsora larici-populina 98AG31]EGG11670.1 multicopper-oxidase laccase-like protein [Melampsora larici-populina 98AG31]